MGFEDVMGELKVAHKATGRSPATTVSYMGVLRLLSEHVGHERTFDSLTSGDVESFIGAVRERASEATAKGYFNTVRAIGTWAVRRGILATNPTALLEPPRAPRKYPPLLSEVEVERLLLEPSRGRRHRVKRDTAMLHLMVGSGMRRAEVCRLTVDDWNAEAGVVLLRRTKARKERLVPLTGAGQLAMRAYLRERNRHWHGTEAMFLSARGDGLTPSGLAQAVRERARATGVDYVRACHTLRGTAAAQMLAAGMNESAVMAIQGWSSNKLLIAYTHAAQSDLAIAAFRRVRS